MPAQRSHARSTSVSSLASVASFKTAHSASPASDHSPLPDDNPDHRADTVEEMLLTPVSSGGSGPPSPPQAPAPLAQPALVAAMQTPLPPTPPPRRRTLLLGKGVPRRDPSIQEPKPPPPALPSHIEAPDESTRSDANGEPGSPRSLASRLSLASTSSQQIQSPTSYESHASRLSQPPAQRDLPEKPDAERWSRPPRSQARKVSKTMQLARGSEAAPLRPGSAASVASVASAASAASGGSSGSPPDRHSGSARTPPTHTRSSSGRSEFEEQDDAWAAAVRAQLVRLFPDLGALPDRHGQRGAPVAGLRDELSALRSEIGALRGVVGQLRGERELGGTPPLATKATKAAEAARAHSVPLPDAARPHPAKARSLAIDTSFADVNAGADDADADSVYSEEEAPAPRRPPLPARDARQRLSMYHPAAQEPETGAGGLTIFATDSDARITLPPSAISLMLDVVRTVDMRTNGIRSDTEIFSEENLANLAISQVMD